MGERESDTVDLRRHVRRNHRNAAAILLQRGKAYAILWSVSINVCLDIKQTLSRCLLLAVHCKYYCIIEDH